MDITMPHQAVPVGLNAPCGAGCFLTRLWAMVFVSRFLVLMYLVVLGAF